MNQEPGSASAPGARQGTAARAVVMEEKLHLYHSHYHQGIEDTHANLWNRIARLLHWDGASAGSQCPTWVNTLLCKTLVAYQPLEELKDSPLHLACLRRLPQAL